MTKVLEWSPDGAHVSDGWELSTQSSYRWNHAAIRAVGEGWGIDGHITIERRRRRYDQRWNAYSVERNTNGWCGWNHEQGHYIMVVSNLLAGFALEVLAHELRHAWQREQFETPREFARAYNRKLDAFEKDADDWAAEHWHELIPTVTFPH